MGFLVSSGVYVDTPDAGPRRGGTLPRARTEGADPESWEWAISPAIPVAANFLDRDGIAFPQRRPVALPLRRPLPDELRLNPGLGGLGNPGLVWLSDLAPPLRPTARVGRHDAGQGPPAITGTPADRTDQPWEDVTPPRRRPVQAPALRPVPELPAIAGTPADRVDMPWDQPAVRSRTLGRSAPLPPAAELPQLLLAPESQLAALSAVTASPRPGSRRGLVQDTAPAAATVVAPPEVLWASWPALETRPRREAPRRGLAVGEVDPLPQSDAALQLVTWSGIDARPGRGSPRPGRSWDAAPEWAGVGGTVAGVAMLGPFYVVASQVSWGGAVAADIVGR